jgi:hypothetical protein
MMADIAASVRARLTSAFYQIPEVAARWKSYLAVGAVMIPPPGEFAEIGERVRRFLGPVHEQLGATGAFTQHWPKGGPWTVSSAGIE